MLSPVSTAWSTADRPRTTVPSTLIRSPGRTTTRSPTRQFLGRDLDLGIDREPPGRSGIDVQQRPDRAAGAVEAEGLETFAQQGDEDDLGRDEILAQAGGRDAGDRQRDVGADGPSKSRQNREIDDAPPADHRRDQGQRDAERPLPRTPDGAEDQVGDEQCADHDRDRHEHPALGVQVVIVVMTLIVIVVVRMAVTVRPRSRCAQAHFLRPILAVHGLALPLGAGRGDGLRVCEGID